MCFSAAKLVCPTPDGGICIEECSSDADCKGKLKCCFNGCGSVCTKPVKVTEKRMFYHL